MPRASDGTYSLPSGSIVNTGDTILPSQHNPPLSDLAQAVTNSVDRDGKGGMRAPLNMGGNALQNLAPGSSSTDAATVGQAILPIGVLLDYAGLVAPEGYMLCAGQALGRTEYAPLFALLGTAYGVGNGTTTFNIPDMRGRVSAAPDNMGGTTANRLAIATALGAAGGEQSHVLTTAEMASHTHTGSTDVGGAHFHNLNAWTGNANNSGGPSGVSDIGSRAFQVTATDGDHSHSFTTDAAGAGAAHNNVQPTLVINKIIKVRA